MGNGGCGQSMSLMLLSPQLFPVFSAESFPWDTVFQKLLRHGSLSWTAVLQELLQCGSFPGIPHGLQFHAGAGFLAGLQLLTGRCSSVGPSQTAAFFRAYSPAVLLGPPWPAEGLVHHYHLLRLQRNLCSNAWSTSSLCFFTDLDFWISFFFSTFFSLLSSTAFAPLFLHSYQNLAT